MKKSVLIINPSPVVVENKYHYKLFSVVRKFAQQVDLISYEVIKTSDILLKLSKKYSHIIVSGTSIKNDPSVDQMRLIKQEYEWMTKINSSILGICYGHHILGFLYGADIFHGEEKESGSVFVKKMQNSVILSGLNEEFSLYQEHRDSISLPTDFVLLASSQICKNQIIKHKDKNIFGIQGHPELSRNDGRKIIENFLRT